MARPPVVASGSRRSTGRAQEAISVASDSDDDNQPVRRLVRRGDANGKRKSMAESVDSDEDPTSQFDDLPPSSPPPHLAARAKGKGRASAAASTTSKRSAKKKRKVADSESEYEGADAGPKSESDDDDSAMEDDEQSAESEAMSVDSDEGSVVELAPPKPAPKNKGIGKALAAMARSTPDVKTEDGDGDGAVAGKGKKVKKPHDDADSIDISDLQELHKDDKVTPFVYLPAAPLKNHETRHARLAAAKKVVKDRKEAIKKAKTDKLKAKAKAEGKIYVAPPKPRTKAQKKKDGDEDSEDDGQGDAFDSDDDPEEVRKALSTAENLPPISNIEDIFEDLTMNAPGLKELAEHLRGETLKVATMCSGTESPLLALGLISRALKAQHGVELKFSHGFSCEIEPFKQAYIERNFSPPVLFADVTELGQKFAHNAYGAQVEVPTDNYTMLIAGTSCVDFSNLNVQKKTITEKGESGRTWHGMISWCKRARPMIVILENVISAPWEAMVDSFEEIGYSAHSTKFDTKKYYIPHTRSRGYQVCFRNPDWDEWRPNRKSQLTDHLPFEWDKLVKRMERPASVSLEAFLLPSDDQRIHQARLDLSKKTKLALQLAQRATTDWGRCQSRHEKARFEEGLGAKRPATAWVEGGAPQLKDGSWGDWAPTQTERVLDLTDVNTLRQAKLGIDSEYKAFVWNLSQNVDRTTGSNAAAISPCLTPNMIAFLTTRGGPVVGLESLALQGLPTDELLLTRETEDQLADLAGNAMTSTVVGTCMVAALIIARPLFDREREERASGKSATLVEMDESSAGQVLGDEGREARSTNTDVVGMDALLTKPFDLTHADEVPIPTLLERAARSARHCTCEGQSEQLDESIQILCCEACGHMVCQNCKGRPLHEYKPSTTSSDRIQPRVFGDELRAMIPTRITFSGVDDAALEAVRARGEDGGVEIADEDWALFKPSLLNALQSDSEYRFKWIRRRDTWALQMELSGTAYLELDLDPVSPAWYLFVLPHREDGNRSRRRALLQPPVARLELDITGSSILQGMWDFSLPSINTFPISLEGCGELVPSWKNGLGLVDHQTEEVHAQIEVSVPAESKHLLDVDISGRYFLHRECGTAQSSLYIRPATTTAKSISFFLDPTRSGSVSKDGFVFAARSDRLEYGERRTIYAAVDPKWRPTQTIDSPDTTCTIAGTWVPAPGVSFAALQAAAVAEMDGQVVPPSTVSLPPSELDLQLTADSCSSATAILSVSVGMAHPEREPKMWKQDEWKQVDLRLKAREFQEQTAWVTERLPELNAFKNWLPIAFEAVIQATDDTCCQRCAPVPAEVGWEFDGSKVVPREDPVVAGEYERALKERPAPFVVQARLDGHLGTMRFAINVASLLHRAQSALPVRADATHTLSWRLTPNHPSVESSIHLSKAFTILSNMKDEPHIQPPSFAEQGMALRLEQLRSFGWAMRQERPEADYTFEEEEIAEAKLGPLGWRAEGRASRKVLVRGGVIADAVGYGKTAISLAVIDASSELPSLEELAEKRRDKPHGKIYTKATLVVVPPHLMNQWEEEAIKFLGDDKRVVKFRSFANLAKYTIEDYQRTDIIIITTTIFNSPRFWQTIGEFSTIGEFPAGKDAGRYFLDRFEEARAGIQKQVDLLTDVPTSGAASVNIRKVKTNIEEGLRLEAERREQARLNKNALIRIGKKKLSGSAYDAHYNANDDIESDDDDTDKVKKAKRVKRAKRDKALAEGKKWKDTSKPTPSVVDPFELREWQVLVNYKKLKCAPLYAFQFERVIVDEFTYVTGRARAAIKNLSAHATWVLSGTPNIESFNEINEIADLLHVHLGVPADLTHTKDAAKDKTSAEMFHSYRETHTQAWRRHRDDVGQRFLDGFVRQNEAEIDEIPKEEHIVRIRLPAAEHALYLELEHHLQTMDDPGVKMTSMAFKAVKKTAAKSVQDRTERLAKATDSAKDIRECLIRRSCGFEPPMEPIPEDEQVVEVESDDPSSDNDDSDGSPAPRGRGKAKPKPKPKPKKKKKVKPPTHRKVTNANGSPLTPTEVCDLIASERRKQLAECLADIRLSLKYTIELYNAINWEKGEAKDTKFIGWVKETHRSGEGDPDVLATIRSIFNEFGISADGKIGPNVKLTPDEAALNWKKGEKTDHVAVLRTVTKGKTQAATGAAVDNAKWDLNEKTHLLKRLSKELRARTRSARYFNAIRHAQRDGPDPDFVCSSCHQSDSAETLVSTCGHSACWDCLHPLAKAGDACPIEDCAQTLARNMLLQVSSLDRDGESGEYGAKMSELIRIVKEVAEPAQENVLVFAQFNLVQAVQEALEANGVNVETIGKGSAAAQSDAVSKFQKANSDQTSVLVLDTAAASAAGANLTQANHTIFFHPIHVPTLHQYKSTDKQSIGRTLRFGQKKTVHIWRLLAINTVDDTIYRERTGISFDENGKPEIAGQPEQVVAVVKEKESVAVVDEPAPKVPSGEVVEMMDDEDEELPALSANQAAPAEVDGDVDMTNADAVEPAEDADGDSADVDETEPSVEDSVAGLPSRDEAPDVAAPARDEFDLELEQVEFDPEDLAEAEK